MEADYDNLSGMQLGLYPPPPGDPLDNLVAAAHLTSIFNDTPDQSSQYPHRTRPAGTQHLGLTEVIDPALYDSENRGFVNIRKKCITDYRQKYQWKGFMPQIVGKLGLAF